MKRAVVLVLAVLLLLPLATPVMAQCPSEGHTVIMHAPAVAKTSTGELTGVVTEFVITVTPGSGHVYIETWPLAQVDMQASARLATQVAGRVLGVNMSHYDVFIQVRANTSIIGGPSAGGTMTVGIIAALMGWKVNPNVMMTGMINPDGSIGPVGGILEKAAAAHQAGVKLFLIPEGQRIQYVQETQKKEIGGVIEINTETKPVDVVKYAEERWGLKVVEVKDIYEAVYYFTGHRLPKPKAPQNVQIDTSFLRNDALSDYKNTTDYYQRVMKELKESNVGYDTYMTLLAALNNAGQLLNQSKGYIDEGLYYTALSKDFQARIVIRHVDWYLQTNTPKDVEELLKNTSETIKSAEAYVENQSIRGITMLQAVAAAEQRIEDAKSNLDQAWKSYYSGDYWDAIGKAAYAYERAKTAILWTDLGKRFAKGEPIKKDLIKATARDYIDESDLIVAYIESMYGDVLGNSLTDTIEKAQQYYDDGKYSAALFTAMQARVQGEVFLDTLAITNWTVLMDKLNMVKGDAKAAIGIAEEKGITPILAIAYYEFAQSFEELAKKNQSTDDLQTAMTFYMYAKETANLFLSTPLNPVPKVPAGNSTVPEVSIPTATSSPAQSSTGSATGEADYGLIGLFAIVAFVVGLAVGRKL
ncbi:S16 family serine protease [Thermococcus nautili]|uniref:Archaeal serine protease n=1 Tax=Thermococcus nautili TaxID=195522 RepID=W8P5Q5_9EURY|nr:S16 family serine protease [Thermococcus nautili]AHL22820.1 Archaeal serine protease [Thermococcus nautili]